MSARLLSLLRRLSADRAGASSVQLAIAGPVLLLATMGIIDFGRAALTWHNIQKAVQVGVQEAVTRDPVVLPIRDWWRCQTVDADDVGRLCLANDGTTLGVYPACDFGSYSCSGTTCSGGAFTGEIGVSAQLSEPAFDGIVERMRAAFPRLTADNVTIRYDASHLGFVAMPSAPVAEVTVEVTGVPFEFVGLAPLEVMTGAFTVPPISAALTAEDLNDNTCAVQGLDGTVTCTQPAGGTTPTQAAVCF